MVAKYRKTTDAQERILRAAIAAAGGVTRMAEFLGYRTTERVRQFYATGTGVPAEKVRAFVAAAKGVVTLHQVRPDLYAGLTVEELGYKPGNARVARGDA